MRLLSFSKRTALEILRDPLNIVFGLGFPVILLLLLSAIQANVPVEIFVIESLAPGMTVFGLAFMTLFSATIISKDRESALFARLLTTPLTAFDFILGYTLPILPIALIQGVVCYSVAMALGMDFSTNIIIALFMNIPACVLFVSIGLLCGSVLNTKQVGGLCGALLTNLTAWFSGIWFDIELVGGVFKKIADVLPFIHAVELQRNVCAGNFAEALPDLIWVMGYAVAILVLSVVVFIKRKKAV